MNRPKIGISLTLDDRGRWRAGRSYHYLDRSYADAISQAGGIALQLPIQIDPHALVGTLDGVLIPGGDDFPSDTALPDGIELDLVSPEQLAFDEALLKAAQARSIPIFGICYGMQLMARMQGGTLDAHLPSQRPEVESHKLPADARHLIRLETASRLAAILGSETCEVNSLHHQAVRRVGPNHRVAALSSDGVIEAIERIDDDENETGPRWELGVQWHPEKMAEDSSRRLFTAFVDACRHSENESQ